MSILADSTSMLAGCLVASIYPGLGAPADVILAASADGDSGAGPLAGLELVANVDYYWVVTSQPASGALTTYEDGSFSHVGAADGVWGWSADVYADGVLTWTLNVSDTIGSGASTYSAPRGVTYLGATPPRIGSAAMDATPPRIGSGDVMPGRLGVIGSVITDNINLD